MSMNVEVRLQPVALGREMGYPAELTEGEVQALRDFCRKFDFIEILPPQNIRGLGDLDLLPKEPSAYVIGRVYNEGLLFHLAKFG